jgi:sn-glycerol 3-phosphate transport system ATP-binding protein
MSILEIQNLGKEWPGFRAVDNVSFTVASGSLTVLLGPSGCGKSTILRMVAGLEEASSGDIFIDSKNIAKVDSASRGVSMVFQSYALFPHLNVRENILFGLKVRKVNRNEQLARLDSAAHLVGLETLLDRKPAQLSGGQRQRVALARTIVSRRPVCLMDEPLSNLDAQLRAEMREEIRRLQQELHLTMLYVTHDQTEAMTMADQVILLNSGRVEQIGTPEQLYNTPASVFVARFIGQPPMNVLDPAVLDTIDHTPSYSDKSMHIGIRPEDVHLTEEGIPAEVEAVDFLGSESLVRLRLLNHKMFVRIQGSCPLRQGHRTGVKWAESAVHFFDKKGKRQGSEKPPLSRRLPENSSNIYQTKGE